MEQNNQTITKPDFNQWIKTLGLKDISGSSVTAELIVFEGLYDLILDLQRQVTKEVND